MRAKDTILWEISGLGVRKSHLFGSFHIGIENAPFSDRFLIGLIENASILYTETSLDIPFDPSLIKMKDWKYLISDRLRLKWLEVLDKRYSFDLDSFFGLPPFILLNLLMVSDLGSRRSIPMDQWFWNEAKKQGLKTSGLSSYVEHYGLLKEIELEDQVKMLKEYIKSYSSSFKKAKNLLDLYQEGRIHQLYKYSTSSLGNYRSLMLTERNVSMAVKIADSCLNNNALFVIGAAHLSGEKGVISLLKHKHGLSVRPVTDNISN